jgi:ornithine cyclodeaminase/alanine dehydrogenase-like protein (mu-crystallin family)
LSFLFIFRIIYKRYKADEGMIQIDSGFINRVNYAELIEILIEGFNATIETPLRTHYNYKNPRSAKDSTLLMMPSWQLGKRLGVKLVTVSPDNALLNLPSIHAQYLLFDALTGKTLALLDGKALTSIRTAAVSAMVSKYLSRQNSKTLLMIGTGDLAPELIKAHCTIREIEHVLIWGRNSEKSKLLAEQMKLDSIAFRAVDSLDEAIGDADIISTATLSETPLIKGALLRKGQHLDLVGSYQPHMREADDRCIQKASVFIDTYEAGMKESGDIAIPLKKGILSEADIQSDIKGLTSGTHPGRQSNEEITLFKSVGHASEDLIAASYFYDRFINK